MALFWLFIFDFFEDSFDNMEFRSRDGIRPFADSMALNDTPILFLFLVFTMIPFFCRIFWDEKWEAYYWRAFIVRLVTSLLTENTQLWFLVFCFARFYLRSSWLHRGEG
jgi:hypothetical protein